MTERKKWIITTSGERSLSEVEQELTEKGFVVEQVLDQIGCLTGTASKKLVRQLETVPGVLDVSPDADIQLPPPDADETW